MFCKTCNRKFHYCHNCGYDRDLHCQSEGFCSDECLKIGGGRTYDELNQDSDEPSGCGEIRLALSTEAVGPESYTTGECQLPSASR